MARWLWNIDMWHRILEYYQECSIVTFCWSFLGKVNYGKMLEYKISWKVLMIFVQESSNDVFWLIWVFYGKV